MTTTTTKTKSQEVAADVTALLRARNPLIWIVTREEARVERYLVEAAIAARYVARTWDIGQGVRNTDGTDADLGDLVDPGAAMTKIAERASAASDKERGLWIMRDLPAWLAGPAGAKTMRELRNLTRSLPNADLDTVQAVVVISPSGDVPAELSGATVIEWPLPDRAEIASILDASIESLPDDLRKDAAPNGTRDAAIDAALGLSGEEAAACYNRSLVQHKRIDVATVAKEKKRVVTREGGVEWHDPLPGGLDAVGGLDNLKAWLKARTSAFTPKARAYGLPSPKGTLIVGIPGTGKSLTAKAFPTAWGVPLLKLDLNALKSKFVGESEGKLRRALKVIEAIGRCVVWIDEIEKALQGATSGASDGGVSNDTLGTVLSWMQDRAGEAFVIATANDVSSLPPELLRKGRFDEVWFVDLPTPSERGAVLRATLRGFGRADLKIDEQAVAVATDNFTGSEIAAIVPEAMFAAFGDGEREIETNDLLAAAKTVVPLATTASEKIDALRKWASTRARPASAKAEKIVTAAPVRRLDVA